MFPCLIAENKTSFDSEKVYKSQVLCYHNAKHISPKWFSEISNSFLAESNQKGNEASDSAKSMTLEVAVLNKQAVALAADSAVTIGGPTNPKIFNTLKLFALSKHQPVGIMVYSSAEIMALPIETAIKVFRQDLGSEQCDTLQEYYDRFQTFLKTDKKLFPDEARVTQCQQVISQNLDQFRRYAGLIIGSKYPNWGEPSSTQVKETVRELLVEHCEGYNVTDDLDGVNSRIRGRLRKELRPYVEDWQKWFGGVYCLAQKDLSLISDLCLNLVLKDNESGCETGFVIAGFGGDEYFPQLKSFEFESSVFNIHKIREQESVDMKTDSPRIIAFAQKEMVETFVRGRSSRLDGELLDFIDQFFVLEKQKIAQNPAMAGQARTIAGFLDSMNNELKTQFKARLEEFTNKNHVDPVEMTVGAMPKEELAKMAQALVNLTAIKRRSTPDVETVGGPTDVAVISKGDGMIWIDRKHYFDTTLNPGFVANYQKGGAKH